MAELVLDAEVRTKTGKGDAKKLRFAKRIPAVIYGKDIVPVHCSLDKTQVDMKVRRANRNALIDIKLTNGESRSVIVRDFQKHPLTHDFDHIDFQAVHMDKPIKIDVALNFVGSPVGKKMGGIFTALCKQVRVECLPGNIPEKIDLKIDDLESGDSLHVSDIKAEGLKIITNPKIALCQVSKVKEEAEATTAEAGAAAPAAEGK